MRENKVIYGLIGYGGMGRWHTEILSNVPEIEIGGIYDIKEEKRIEAKEKGFSVYGSEEEMLSDPDIDVVLIATPNDCQFNMINFVDVEYSRRVNPIQDIERYHPNNKVK